MRTNPNAKQLRPPIHRSWLRLRLGKAYYAGKRYLLWCSPRYHWASQRQSVSLPYIQTSHATPLYRHLRGEEMELQKNKVVNLQLAAARLNGVVLRPGETFSYWRLIGKPSRKKGYREGMVLFLGRIGSDVGGGLCQLSNLIFWMTLHTPLTVVERYRHSHDVFPEFVQNGVQPFRASGIFHDDADDGEPAVGHKKTSFSPQRKGGRKISLLRFPFAVGRTLRIRFIVPKHYNGKK